MPSEKVITESLAHSASAFAMAGESSDLPLEDCTVQLLASTTEMLASTAATAKIDLMIETAVEERAADAVSVDWPC